MPDHLLFLGFAFYFVLNLVFFRLYPIRLAGREEQGLLSAGRAGMGETVGLDLNSSLDAARTKRKAS